MRMFKQYVIFYSIVLLLGCSAKSKLLSKINKSYYGAAKQEDRYVISQRKHVFSQIKGSILKADTIIFVEEVVSIQDFYSCAIFTDSLLHYFQAGGLEKPVDISISGTSDPLAHYIYEKIRLGQLEDVQAQGAKVYYSHPAAIFVTRVLNTQDQTIVEAYDLYKFLPREEQERREKLKEKIRRQEELRKQN